ncbi:MAG: carbamoyltransferase HypF, partial [Verrucomicrobiota bacterium]
MEGPRGALERFLLRLEKEQPPRSFIQSLESSWLDVIGYEAFEIRESEIGGGKTTLILPDIATCPDCLREIFDPTNRRYRYPFTNCTNCGPRFSIIESLPYDRANTSMKAFAMCPECQAEYDYPRDRRFHAQPNACPVCGPHLEFWNRSRACRSADRSLLSPRSHERGYDVLLAAAEALRCGQIVAGKGIGGFHLMVDSCNDEAVRRLRKRKHREEKPLALMFPSLNSAKAVCEISPLEERLLRSPEAPIVLLRRVEPLHIPNLKSQIADSVAPHNPNLGVMLPSNPLHHLLMAELGFPVVATSGNLSDEPICTDEYEVLDRLRDIADVFLVHNRPIVRHMDDSIVRMMLNREMILRRARGYAPLPVTVGTRSIASQFSREVRDAFHRVPTILAVGAHLKNSVALSVGDQVFISQHIGDLETEQANHAFHRVAADLPQLYDAQPKIIAADLHPDYLSTKYAQAIGRAELPLGQDAQQRVPTKVGVQHHIAHVLSCMAENEIAPPVLGVAWDGTGYGIDGTIWGGEFFLVTENDVERVARLRPFRLPGGDAAVHEPRRAALGLLHEMFGSDLFRKHDSKPLEAFSAAELGALTTMLARGLNSPSCCSVGRLFDAVASLTGSRQKMRFEGQAAMELEFALEGVVNDEAYELAIGN